MQLFHGELLHPGFVSKTSLVLQPRLPELDRMCGPVERMDRLQKRDKRKIHGRADRQIRRLLRTHRDHHKLPVTTLLQHEKPDLFELGAADRLALARELCPSSLARLDEGARQLEELLELRRRELAGRLRRFRLSLGPRRLPAHAAAGACRSQCALRVTSSGCKSDTAARIPAQAYDQQHRCQADRRWHLARSLRNAVDSTRNRNEFVEISKIFSAFFYSKLK